MDASHSVKQFMRILTCHSKAQPFYPTMGMNAEVASPFSDDRKIQIVWNSGSELFKKRLTTLGISRREDFKSQFQTCKDTFLIAEQHRTAKEAKAVKPKPPSNVDKNKGGGDKDKTGHKAADCFQNPTSHNYRPQYNGQPGGGEPAKKRKFDLNCKNDPKFQKWKENKKQYEAYMVDTAEDGYIEE